MSAQTIQQLVSLGPPDDGTRIRSTHTHRHATMAEMRGHLLYGLPGEGVVHRDYAWRRLTGAVRLETGRIRQQMHEQVAMVPAIVAASLETLAGQPASPSRVASLALTDVLYLLFVRASEILRRVPVVPEWRCPGCGGDAGEIGPEHVTVFVVDHEPDHPPRAVVWLESPFQHGNRTVEALVLGQATWGAVFAGATMTQMRNREWMHIMSVAAGCVGYVHDGQLVEAPIPASVLTSAVDYREWDRLSTGITKCSGLLFPGASMQHSCGDPVVIPFDSGMSI